jgi:hypothetical protein
VDEIMGSDRTTAQYTELLGALPAKVVVVEEVQGFAVLEEEWKDLYCDCPRAISFQSWAWLYSWWEAAARRETLQVTVEF